MKDLTSYHFAFIPTGVECVDNILAAVCRAGDAYHHTSQWTDPASYFDQRGSTPVDMIQFAANDAARIFKNVTEQNL